MQCWCVCLHGARFTFFRRNYKKIKKKYLFYDGHEYFPELFADNTVFPQLIRPIVIKIMESIEKILARHADIVITVDPYLKERYLKYNDNVYIFPNYPILQVFTNEMANQSGNGLIYIGYLKLEKGLHQILQAASTIKNSNNLCWAICFEFWQRQDWKIYQRKSQFRHYNCWKHSTCRG